MDRSVPRMSVDSHHLLLPLEVLPLDQVPTSPSFQTREELAKECRTTVWVIERPSGQHVGRTNPITGLHLAVAQSVDGRQGMAGQ